MPFEQVIEQQSVPMVQSPPLSWQLVFVHTPPVQRRLPRPQHSLELVQVAPST